MATVTFDPESFANDTLLLAAFPVRAAHSGEPRGFYVAVERRDLPVGETRDRWVSAFMWNLSTRSWSHGAYHDRPEAAIAAAVADSGWTSAALAATERYYTAQ